MEGSAKEHVCMTHRHRQQCGDGLREGGNEDWVKVGKGRRKGTSANSVSNKNKIIGRKENIPIETLFGNGTFFLMCIYF